MRFVELILIAVLHLCAVVLGAIIMASLGQNPTTLIYVIAAILASQAAGWLFYRREPIYAPYSTRLLVGAVMAAMVAIEYPLLRAPVFGAPGATEASGEIFAITLSGTFLTALFLFNTMRKAHRHVVGEHGVTDLRARSLISFSIAMLAATGIAVALVRPWHPAWLRVATHELPGLRIDLPNWREETRSSAYALGTIKLQQPI